MTDSIEYWIGPGACCAKNDTASVRKAAYALFPYCTAHLTDWNEATAVLAGDLCSFDVGLRVASLGALPSFPLTLLLDRETDAPGQLWIGGAKDEPHEVHSAALAALRQIVFESTFLNMPNLMYDSWNYIVERALEPGELSGQALGIISGLFAARNRAVPPGSECAGDVDEETPLHESLAMPAEHVASALLPHVSLLVENVSGLPDSDKSQCVYALTHLMVLSVRADDSNVLEVRMYDVPSTYAPTETRGGVLKAILRYFLVWIESTDSALVFAVAKSLLELAQLYPLSLPEWTTTSISALTNLLRKDSPETNKEVLDVLLPAISQVSYTYWNAPAVLIVQTIENEPDRTTRMVLLMELFERGSQAAVVGRAPRSWLLQLLFNEYLGQLWKDEKHVLFCEEILAVAVEHFSKFVDIDPTECSKLAEMAIGCLSWNVKNHRFPLELFLRFFHRVMVSLAAKSEYPVRLFEILRGEVFQSLTKLQSDWIAILVIFIITRHLPSTDLETGDRGIMLLSLLKGSFLKMDEFDKYNANVVRLRNSGRIASVSSIPKPAPIQFSATLQCLLLLASRVPVLVQTIFAVVDEFSRHFEDDNQMQEMCSSLKLRVYSLKSVPVPLKEPPHLLFPTVCECLGNPVGSREDDGFLISLAQATNPFERYDCLKSIKVSPGEVISGDSDVFRVTVNHIVNPLMSRVTLHVKIANTSPLSVTGCKLLVSYPEHMDPLLDTSSGVVSQSVLPMQPYASREFSFPFAIKYFAPLRLSIRLSVGTKNRPTTSDTLSSAVDDEESVEDLFVELPSIYMDAYVVPLYHLIAPLCIDEVKYGYLWSRMPAEMCDDYQIVPSEAGLVTVDVLCTKLDSMPFYRVSHKNWGAGFFESNYVFATWFDDVFALRVCGRQLPLEQRVHARLQWRCTNAHALAALQKIATTFTNAVFGGAGKVLPRDDAVNTFFTTNEAQLYSVPSEKTRLSCWQQLRKAK
eukprot:m51a1_g151 TSET complex, TPLATE subunit (975) ;mRNA; r:478065-482042